jgi:hypothetical protein
VIDSGQLQVPIRYEFSLKRSCGSDQAEKGEQLHFIDIYQNDRIIATACIISTIVRYRILQYQAFSFSGRQICCMILSHH